MERKVVLGVFLLILPFGCFGVGLHGIVKRGANGEHHWGYETQDGPKTWPSHWKTCGDKRQSPIDIDTDDVQVDDDLDDFEFDNFYINFENALIENNGHTVQVKPSPTDAPRTFKSGGFDDEHQFLQLHFHWGSKDNIGSEHLIDSKAYPMEMHLVFMNKKYATPEEAKTKSDGLAVLGVLFKVGDDDNEALEEIIDELSDVKEEKKSDKVGAFNLRSLLPKHTMPYYRYDGSLTTPPCSQVVTWTIFKEFVEISAKQLEQFRQITENDDGEPTERLVDNFRPPQKLYDRVVYVSGTSNSASSLIPSVLTAVFTAISFVL